nr:hypothetical protein [Bacilli bacterium]
LQFQEELSIKYKYRKLKESLSKEIRQKYLDNLPTKLNINGDLNFKIHSIEGTLISNGYNRIVIGDYGAFIEFDKTQVIKSNLKIKTGQEYRISDPKYSEHVKYYWLTPKDDSNMKVYYQKRTVSYADYKPEMFYVSPYEVLLGSNI